MTIVLSKGSRAFIGSQGGLPGFLVVHHDNFASFTYELKAPGTELYDSMRFLSVLNRGPLVAKIEELAAEFSVEDLATLQGTLSKATDDEEKLQAYFDLLYNPPSLNDMPWYDVSCHIRDKLDPFLRLVDSILPESCVGTKEIVAIEGTGYESLTYEGKIFNGLLRHID